jgi:hypothetical protein
MMSRVLATIANGGKVAPGVLGHGDPDPAEERCDRCVATARILLEHDADTLALCLHHYERNWQTLLAGGWEVTRDTRAELFPVELRPSVPVVPGPN